MFLLLCTAISWSYEEKEIQLLVLTPYPQPQLGPLFRPSLSDGPALHLAAEMAAELVNSNSSSILQGYHLTLQPGDSGCSIPFRAIEGFAGPLITSIQNSSASSGKKRPPIVGVIGPACSLSAVHVSSVTGRSEIALVNVHLAGSVQLNDRTRYPYTFGILDSAELIALSMVSLIGLANWSKIAIFYDSSREFFSSIVQQFNEKTVEMDGLDYSQVPVSASNLTPLLSIKSKIRIVFLMVDLDLISRLMCMALHHNFSPPTYQFILVIEDVESIGPAENIVVNDVPLSCSQSMNRRMLNDSILILFQLQRLEKEFVTSSGLSLSEFNRLYSAKVEESNRNSTFVIEETIYAVNFFDAAWAFILALNNSARTLDLSKYRLGQQNATDIIREELLRLDFEGLSGRIQFSNTTGRPQLNESIFRVHETGMTHIATYIRKSNAIFNVTDQELVFVSDKFDVSIVTVSKAFIGVMLTIIIFALCFTVLLNYFTCRYRKSDSVKASSVKLIQLAFFGCYIHVVSLVFVIVIYGFADMIDNKSICIVQSGLDFSLSVGLTVLLGAICVRIWRIYRIFNHFNNPGKLLSDYILISVVLVIVAVNIILTIPPFFLDRYEPSPQSVSNSDPHVVSMTLGCKRKNLFLWFFLGLLVDAVLLTIICALGILTRKIPIKNFKTKSMINMSYALTAIIPFTLGLYILFVSLDETNYIYLVVKFCTLCVLLLSLIVIPCIFLFFPPIQPLVRHKLFQSGLTLLTLSPH